MTKLKLIAAALASLVGLTIGAGLLRNNLGLVMRVNVQKHLADQRRRKARLENSSCVRTSTTIGRSSGGVFKTVSTSTWG